MPKKKMECSFCKYKSGEILDIGKKIVKTLFDKIFSPLGYIQNQDGIFLFYNIDFLSLINTLQQI